MNTHVKMPVWLKLIIILIPLAIFGYIITVNFLINQEFNYFYDIGGEEDNLRPYLTPLNRTSEIKIFNEASYRNVNFPLIYFDVPIFDRSDKLDLQIKYLAMLNNSVFLGVKIGTGWNFTWIELNNSYIDYDWSIMEKDLNLTNFFIENEKLNLAINVPRLPNETLNNLIFYIDWINITVQKPGVWR